MSENDDRALVLMRPQVLSKISDLYVDNGMPPLEIPRKDALVWTPDREIARMSAENNSLRYSSFVHDDVKSIDAPILPVRDSGGNHKGISKFEAIVKKSAEIRKLQGKIEHELRFDEVGGLARISHQFFGDIKRKLGLKVRTLEDLFDEEQKLVGEMHGALTRLHGLCNQHYNSLVSFRAYGNNKLAEIVSERPTRVENVTASKYDFHDSMRELSRLDAGNPGFYRVRENAARMRDQAVMEQHYLALNDEKYQLTNMFLERIDVASQILLSGKNSVERMGSRYEIAKEFLQAWPALNTIRNLFKYVATMKDVNDALNITFKQAKMIESDFENPQLVARVYYELPNLGESKSMVGIIDNLNTQLYLSSSGRKKK